MSLITDPDMSDSGMPLRHPYRHHRHSESRRRPPSRSRRAPLLVTGNDPHLQDRVKEVHRRLCASYSAPFPYPVGRDPLDELVLSLLSHRTRSQDSQQALDNLHSRFQRWQDLIEAPESAVREAIAPCTWPEQKAPRLQQVLSELARRRDGVLSLDFLAALSPAEARLWLESVPGIGPRTSATVLLFSRLRIAALPVDSHHHRVAQRLGLIPLELNIGPAHAVLQNQLPESWDASTFHDHHQVMIRHGQRCCDWREPACQRCPLLDLCPSGQQRTRLQKD